MDGVNVGLQDGSFQDVKCGVVYELSKHVEVNEERWELLKAQRCALRGDVAEFRKHLWALILRAGVRMCDWIVVIGDGAEWIDNTVEIMFGGSLRILDYYHAAERIWAVANARWGDESRQAKQWAEERLRQMKEGKLEKVIAAIKRVKMKGRESEAIRVAAVNYLKARQQQMEYGKYVKQGLLIGSGAIESTCKQIVTARCKQAGMRWSEAGVDAIVALRCFVLNDRFDELCPKPKLSLDWQQAA